ncbi:MAG: hypothetical protein K2N56_09065 [Oscillospiraceae bacterium]|nr:hypothetical protein [Oscillospiraceae bacterium]
MRRCFRREDGVRSFAARSGVDKINLSGLSTYDEIAVAAASSCSRIMLF